MLVLVVDETTWEFILRPGVVFHDGGPFGAEDVAASIRRIAWVPNSPGSYLVYTHAISEIVIVDDHAIRFKTTSPYPLLPVDLSSIDIVPRQLARARAQVDNADARMTEVREDAVRQIVLANNALPTSLSAYAASRSLETAARTTFDAALTAYRSGVGSITDLRWRRANSCRPRMGPRRSAG